VLKRIGALLWLWIPVFLWMGFIFYSSSISGHDIPKVDIPNVDKLFHSIEYFILGFLLLKAFFHSFDKPNYKYIFIAAVLIASLYGASDEFHQRFVSARTCDIFDLLFDIIGSIAGAALSLYKEKIKRAVDKTV
jgi:VanZ family protein